jgi:glycosyltransferase involved in cell wall biosynthesis
MTAATPLVSVVMPFLDGIHFLPEAIDSVVTQTYPEWELLLVDDGSTDGSSALARDYARGRPDRIRYLEHAGHANRGKSTSRNLGLAEARGELLAFLDADDIFLPDKLTRQVGLLQDQADTVMVYGNTEYWVSWDPDRSVWRRDRLGRLGVATGRICQPPLLLEAWLRQPGIVPCICALLARRATAVACGGFDESIQDMYEDQVFLAKMVLAGPVRVEPGCGERYRQHAGSTSARAIEDQRYHPTRPNESRRAFLQWLSSYVARHPASCDETLARALRVAQRPYGEP